jgi:hypothetical protein
VGFRYDENDAKIAAIKSGFGNQDGAGMVTAKWYEGECDGRSPNIGRMSDGPLRARSRHRHFLSGSAFFGADAGRHRRSSPTLHYFRSSRTTPVFQAAVRRAALTRGSMPNSSRSFAIPRAGCWPDESVASIASIESDLQSNRVTITQFLDAA